MTPSSTRAAALEAERTLSEKILHDLGLVHIGEISYEEFYKANNDRIAQALQPQWQTMESAPKSERILTYDDGYIRCATHCYDEQWMQGSDPSHTPTHWMPLPQKPGGGDE
jgi:hypothetical protein